MDDVEFEEVRILRLQPGDIVVATTPRDLDEQEFERLRATLAERFPDNEVLVAVSDVQLSVMRGERA